MKRNANRINNRNTLKNRIIFISLICLFCLSIFFYIFYINKSGPRLDDASVVAYVDGAPVTLGEFGLFVMRDRASAYNNYDADQISLADFWTRSFDGRAPVELLADLALGDLIPNKVAQNLAARKGLIEPFDYERFISQLDEVNEARRNDVENGEVVYGIVAFDEFSFYNYFNSTLRSALYDALEEEYANAAIAEDSNIDASHARLREEFRNKAYETVRIAVERADIKPVKTGLPQKAALEILSRNGG